MKNKKTIFHVISHTHWDREWYQPFQSYRKRLVYQLEELIKILETNSKFKHYHLDGQTSLLFDFLEIRPDLKDKISKFIKNGKILIGPWFTMPDEFLVSGESIVRNLLLGQKICNEFGVNPMPVGYVTDVFGHISQLPQIFKNFEIDTVLLNRGTSCENDKSEMVWYASDGSFVLLLKAYYRAGYGDFKFCLLDKSSNLLMKYEDYVKEKTKFATTNIILALEGNDHTGPYADIDKKLDNLNTKSKDVKFIHSSFSNYLKELYKAMGNKWWQGKKVFKGELRLPNKSGQWAEIFNGTGSARYNLKYQNDLCETILIYWVEPFNCYGCWIGVGNQKPFIDRAWKYLLLNHPHDSIVGCSIDQVHKDMLYRFDQAKIIADDCISESMLEISERINTTNIPGDLILIVMNPASKKKTGLIITEVEIPYEKDKEYKKQNLKMSICDREGNILPVQILSVEENIRPHCEMKKVDGDLKQYMFIGHETVNRYRVVFPATVSENGYSSFGISFAKKINSLKSETVKVTNNFLENSKIRIKVKKDGRLDILDKETGFILKGVNYFEDAGDAGHGWDYISPEKQKIYLSINNPVKTRIITRGFIGQIEIKQFIKVPVSLNPDRKSRTEKLVSIPITTQITLYTGQSYIDFKVSIDNYAKDHRIRAMFPSGLNVKEYYVDTVYDIVRRQVKLIDTTGWREQVAEHAPFKNFICINDSKKIIAIITKGLNEGCVRDDKDRTIALTLFRAFEEDLVQVKTRDSQMIGKLEFEYRLLMFKYNEFWQSELFRETELYKFGLKSRVLEKQNGTLPDSCSFIQIEEPLVFSTLKNAEELTGYYILRIFNPTNYPVKKQIRFFKKVQSAWLSNMKESKLNSLKIINGNKILISSSPKKIVTILFKV